MINLKEIFNPAQAFLWDVSLKLEEAVEGIHTISARELLMYALSQKGQMLRPSLIYAIAYAQNPQIGKKAYEKLVYYAAAIELLHTASLVHDDIIDETVERRGKRSIYSLKGSKNAVLTGNIFYLTAFDITNKHLETPQIDSIIRAASDMCCGEVLQLHNKDNILSPETYFEITGKKTASLIKYAFREASRISGTSEQCLSKLQLLGESLGILYQLYDDFKDEDVNLEAGFDFKFYSAKHLSKAEKILEGFEESLYKNIFVNFLSSFRNVFNNSFVIRNPNPAFL